MVETQPVSREEWYELAARFRDFGFRHAWDFNVHSAKRQGSRVEHVKITVGDIVVGLASVRIKLVPLIGTGVAYIGGGPLTRRGEPTDQEHLRLALTALRDEYVETRGLVLRVSAPLVEPALVGPTERVYESLGFERTTRVDAYRTMMLDLSPPLDELRAGFTSRWRRGLSRSLRTAWEIEIGAGVDPFDEFRALFERFVDWKSFDVDHDARFHQVVQADLPDEAQYLVVLARYEGELAGGIVAARTGDTAVYILGAMNPGLRERAPGYALQWRSVQHLKELGIHWYDLGGIDPDGNEGVYKFKSGMAQLDLSAPGPFECSPGSLRRTMVVWAEVTYGGLRRFRRG